LNVTQVLGGTVVDESKEVYIAWKLGFNLEDMEVASHASDQTSTLKAMGNTQLLYDVKILWKRLCKH